MQTLQQKIEDLNALVLDGRALEAFELYYHPDVVMQENELAPTVGKDANRQREQDFFGRITDFRGAEVRGVAVGEDLTAVVWHYDYTHQDWGVRNYTQASVQHWQDGLIIREQFFYGS
ncbi:nuclear transport factor 2 family protein [Hymenobacter sp. BT664]|uniref:Nuclear transport factor 2 family protein n=1 Tax=Hymenobacter montanus TaxID=2771359 RepID=A0A927GLI2_9BACT|nr:nuclear transport factor 2 family protein [Hymenobacter montanus]MBD2770214.1 nuclear transport factor 2 family protein [Hymenobacter montanus]